MIEQNLILAATLIAIGSLVASCDNSDAPSLSAAPKDTRPATGSPTPSKLEPAKSGPEKVLPRYDQAVYMATHNSYSGDERGSIIDQLDEGVRFIELDVWDDRFATDGDLHVGHDAIGHEVALGSGNPGDTKLASWLALVNTWSIAHPEHVPIVVSLDLKSDMTSTAGGGADPDAIDKLLRSAFEEKLFPAAEVLSKWPSIESMRGKILVMLSGHEPSRKAYRAREERIAFIDFQLNDTLDRPEHFMGVRTGDTEKLRTWEQPGLLTRVWRFGDETSDYDFRVHFPATDRPFSELYKSYCEKEKCVQ